IKYFGIYSLLSSSKTDLTVRLDVSRIKLGVVIKDSDFPERFGSWTRTATKRISSCALMKYGLRFCKCNQRFATCSHSIGRFASPISNSLCYQTRLSGSICAAAHPLPTALNLATLMSSPHRELERPRL